MEKTLGDYLGEAIRKEKERNMRYIYLLKLTHTKVVRKVIGDSYVRGIVHLMSAIVVASDEAEARSFCNDEARDENDPDCPDDPDFGAFWLDPIASSCKKLGVAEGDIENGIVHEDLVDGS